MEALLVFDVASCGWLVMILLVDQDVVFSTTVFAETREKESTRAMRRACMNEGAGGQEVVVTRAILIETERKLTGDGREGRKNPTSH